MTAIDRSDIKMDIRNTSLDFIELSGAFVSVKVDISNIVRVSTRQVGEDVVAESRYFFFETSSSFKGGIAIVCGGYEKCGPAFDINRVDYPFHVVKYTIRGKGALTIHGQTHKLESGVLSSFSPGVAHEYKADPADPMVRKERAC